MTIIQTITPLPTPPDPAIDDNTTFPGKATAFTVAMAAMGPELNTLAAQINAEAAAINAAVQGGAFAIDYEFDSSTSITDPGAGKIRFNNATQNLATSMALDNLSGDGGDWGAALDLFDDSTSTVKGYITVRKQGDGTKYIVFAVSAVVNGSGYRQINGSVAASSAANPFAAGEDLEVSFVPKGDKGDTGAAGATGPVTEAQVQAQTHTAFGTTGGATFVLTPSPALGAYAAGVCFDVTFNFTCGDDATINISGLGAINLVKQKADGTYTNVKSGDIQFGHRSRVRLLSVSLALVERLPAATPADAASVPAGRITLTSGTPVTAADVSGATTVYFTPYRGNKVPVYDGVTWSMRTIGELSQTTSDTTKSPAAVANNSNYDLFVWDDSGTMRCTRGPAWSSDTSRGTGAGTTELSLFEGRYYNANNITNGPAAGRGTYVGTIRSDGSAQINDTMAKRHVWNMYNRVARPMRVLESADSWNYSTAAWRQMNNSTANQLDFVRGLDEDSVHAETNQEVSSSTATIRIARCAIGLDSVTAFATGCMPGRIPVSSDAVRGATASYVGLPGIGRHYLAALEQGAGSDTQTWSGDGGSPTFIQNGITGSVMA